LAISHSVSTVLRVATRGVGNTIPKKAHDGWPRLSRNGWPFGRWLKLKGDFESKQAKARRNGHNKGRPAQQLHAQTRSEPMYLSSAETLPTVRVGGIGRPLSLQS